VGSSIVPLGLALLLRVKPKVETLLCYWCKSLRDKASSSGGGGTHRFRHCPFFKRFSGSK